MYSLERSKAGQAEVYGRSLLAHSALLLCVYIRYLLTNFEALYLSVFLMDLGQILDYKSYDQAYHTTPWP